MIKSKVVVAVGMSIVFVILVAMINYVAAFMRWGYRIFETEALIRTLEKYALSGIYMSCITLGIVALSICTRSAWKTIVITVLYLILDSFVYSADLWFLKKIWLGYFYHLWMFAYEYRRFPLKDAILGIALMGIYGFFFYGLASYKTKKMDF